MRRVLTVFLLLILPLQLSWAVAAAYCQHEAPAQVAGHLGHHEHQHAQDTGESNSDVAHDAAADGKPPCVDDDCAYCHLACVKTVTVPAIVLAVTAGTTFVSQAVPPLTSHPGGRIDRPNWRAA